MSTLLLPPSSRPPVLYLPLLKPVAWKWYILAPLLALAGGCFGIFGAFITEAFHGSLFPAYIAGPIIEEALKPSGVYFMLARWPRVLRNQLYTALLAALGGVSFALIENLVYLNIYIEDPGPDIILWRYTAGVGLHALCSFIFGWGINRKLLASIKGETRFLSYGKRFFFSAAALHSLYNIGVTVMALKYSWFR
jgi:RsiW-degrading membrane proteinase PrsW (M82 family)